MAEGNYDHVWDCCCDHGYLGAHLLSLSTQSTIHFVDIVPSLMFELEQKLHKHMAQYANQWQVHCLDIATLPLQQYPGRHLIIIAGIGGELMQQLLLPILNQSDLSATDLLLCPVNNAFQVRTTCCDHGLSLIDERLIVENGRYYELLKVHQQPDGKPLSLVGDKIWQVENTQQEQVAQHYLNKTLRHYTNLIKSDPNTGNAMISAYQNVRITLKSQGNDRIIT
jgi:tRNA (adenine22-N1)-methyltransferase